MVGLSTFEKIRTRAIKGVVGHFEKIKNTEGFTGETVAARKEEFCRDLVLIPRYLNALPDIQIFLPFFWPSLVVASTFFGTTCESQSHNFGSRHRKREKWVMRS